MKILYIIFILIKLLIFVIMTNLAYLHQSKSDYFTFNLLIMKVITLLMILIIIYQMEKDFNKSNG